jgi:hypothetical protein
MLQILVQKTRFKHVLRRKIFLTLFLCPENFLEKKELAKKNLSTQAKSALVTKFFIILCLMHGKMANIHVMHA